MNRLTKQIIITIAAIVVVFASVIYFNRVKIGEWVFELQKKGLPAAKNYDQATKKIGFVNGSVEEIDIIPLQADLKMQAHPATAGQASNQQSAAGQKPETSSIPEEFNLNVPFTTQAPFGVWDEVHDDACEEASVIMAASFVLKKDIPDAGFADKQILSIVDWEKKNFGFWKDTDAEKTAEILRKYYGLKNIEVKYDITLDDIRTEVGRGYPVIVPLYGRGLNPYFRGGGPLYHMVVVKGYTKDGQFITNDPGTKRGKDYVYDGAYLMERIHDWNGRDVLNGRRAMIIVKE
jgi:hypothetical protein